MTTTNDAGTLREKINKIMKDVAQQSYDRGAYGGWTDDSTYYAPDDATNAVIAAVEEAMLSEDVLEELNSAVEIETINVHSGEFRVNAHEMMNAALNMAGITERERE